MHHIGRKAAAALAPLALVVGLVAPSFASAAAPDVLPPPGGPHLREEWSKVKCTLPNSKEAACNATPFLTVSTESLLKLAGVGQVANCEVVLEGIINADGTTEVVGGEVVEDPAEPICGAIGLNFEKEWNDEVCQFKETGEMWDRLEVHFTAPVFGEIEGPIFIHFVNAAGGSPDPLLVARAIAPESEIDNTGFSITATEVAGLGTPYNFTINAAHPQVKLTSVSPECEWPADAEGNIE